MKYIRFDKDITLADRTVINNIKFYNSRASLIVLKDDIDDDRSLEISIRPSDREKNLQELRVTVHIIDKNYPDEIIIMPYIETNKTYIKIYKVKFQDTIYYINLKMESRNDDFMDAYQEMQMFESLNLNISDDIHYFDDLINSMNLSTDIELMKFVCAVLSQYHKLDDRLIEACREKLDYYGYDEDAIVDDVEYETDNDYKINAMNYLMRKLYNIYEDIDKEKYLEERDFFANTKTARTFFDDYIVRLQKMKKEIK